MANKLIRIKKQNLTKINNWYHVDDINWIREFAEINQLKQADVLREALKEYIERNSE